MHKFNIRYVIVLIILAGGALLNHYIQYRQHKSSLNMDIHSIPLYIEEWQGKELSVDKNTKDILETDAVLMRKYVKDDDEVVLAIVYYEESRVALHLPESCYTGQGSYITQRTVEKIPTKDTSALDANKLVLMGDKGNQVIYYYFETEGLKTASYRNMRLQLMMNRIRLKENRGALVRYSISMGNDINKTSEVLREFVRVANPVITEYLFGSKYK